jgi:hypothetical protein
MSSQKAVRLLLQNKPPSASAVAAGTSRGLAPAPPGTVLLDFEGVENFERALGYYDGEEGGGIDYGVYFGSSWVGLVDSDAGGTGEIANEPSNSTVLTLFTFDEYVNSTVSVEEGFTQLSFQYASTFDVDINVYDGPLGYGELIDTGTLLATGVCDDEFVEGEFPFCGDPTGFVGVWLNYSVPEFEGVARSVAFMGPEDGDFVLLIDDMIITPTRPVCAGTTYWLWDPVTNAQVGDELVDGSYSCIPPLYNIEVRPCALPESVVRLVLQRVGAPRPRQDPEGAPGPVLLVGGQPLDGRRLPQHQGLDRRQHVPADQHHRRRVGGLHLHAGVHGVVEKTMTSKRLVLANARRTEMEGPPSSLP